MLILGQKSCFLRPTIFEIPQQNWYYSRVIRFWVSLLKDWSKTKRTMLVVGLCTTISGHFFDNCINSFCKTEVQKVVLMRPIYKDLNWVKSYDHENLQLINCHCTPISGQFLAYYCEIFHKTQVQTASLWPQFDGVAG